LVLLTFIEQIVLQRQVHVNSIRLALKFDTQFLTFEKKLAIFIHIINYLTGVHYANHSSAF
jgi:hypothetical protein